jgi:predicted DNA-binding transcriptional regulator AlpA
MVDARTELLDPILTSKVVCESLSISLSTLKRMVKRHDFPAPVRLSTGRRGWRRRTVEDWLRHKAQATDPSFEKPQGSSDQHGATDELSGANRKARELAKVDDWLGHKAQAARVLFEDLEGPRDLHAAMDELSGAKRLASAKVDDWVRNTTKSAGALFDKYPVLNYLHSATDESSGANRSDNEIPDRVVKDILEGRAPPEVDAFFAPLMGWPPMAKTKW